MYVIEPDFQSVDRNGTPLKLVNLKDFNGNYNGYNVPPPQNNAQTSVDATLWVTKHQKSQSINIKPKKLLLKKKLFEQEI